MSHNSLLRCGWALCSALTMVLAACWVDFPLSRMNRDGRTSDYYPWPDQARGDQPVVPPTDGPREAARDLGPTPELKLTDFRTEGTTCTANAFMSCNGKDVVRCNAAGNGTVTVSCPSNAKCDTGLKRCTQCDPASAATCQGSAVRTCSLADGLWVDTPCPTPGTCQGGKCCTGADADADGYTTCTGDCNDSNKDVHPGQTTYFSAPIPGTTGFDYDCSGAAEQQYTNIVNCQVSGPSCTGDGWATAAPACGQSGTWQACSKSSGSCATTDSTRTQACH